MEVVQVITKCGHIYGYEEGVYESWLNYEQKHWSEYDSDDVMFNYCPICGEKLLLEKSDEITS